MGGFDRYSRQLVLPVIGEEGQRKLQQSSVLVVGCGALGTVAASCLVRAGVGRVRIVDRDFIEYHNLQRQVLFDEQDVREQVPKAKAAERYLRKVNSSVVVEGIVEDVNYTNVQRLMQGMDLAIDGLDNAETRYLVNDAALKLGVPWVYGAAIATTGMLMSVVPGETPCLRCVFPTPPEAGSGLTCETAGVLNSVPAIVASLQCVEGVKLLTGATEGVGHILTVLDVWDGRFNRLEVKRSPGCPACNGVYEFLQGAWGTKTTTLCGQNAVQVLSQKAGKVAFDDLAGRLTPLGEVTYNKFLLRFSVDGYQIVVFPDGRAVIKGTSDETVARGLYAKYIGV